VEPVAVIRALDPTGDPAYRSGQCATADADAVAIAFD